MTNQNTIIEQKDFDDAIAQTPEEVRDFMWSDAFTYILDITQKTLSLSKDEKEMMRFASYDLLVGLTDMEKIAKDWLSEGIDPEKITKMLYIIHTEILTRAKNILLNSVEEDSKETPPETMQPSSTVGMFDQLKQNLVQPTTFAPTKRVYDSVDSPQAIPKPISTPLRSENSAGQATTPPKIDPYRELPLV